MISNISRKLFSFGVAKQKAKQNNPFPDRCDHGLWMKMLVSLGRPLRTSVVKWVRQAKT